MAKDKKKAKGKKAKPGKVEKKFRKATEKAAKLAANPIVAEIASAALLAAAAAVRNPDKARKLAKAAGDELSEAARLTAKRGGAFWQLAIDIARRSVDALGEDQAPAAAKKAAKKPAVRKAPVSKAAVRIVPKKPRKASGTTAIKKK